MKVTIQWKSGTIHTLTGVSPDSRLIRLIFKGKAFKKTILFTDKNNVVDCLNLRMAESIRYESEPTDV